MKHDTVSIIIPIYKVSAYLDQCVASACAQTYPYLQIILVDDGSPDECGAMCDEWANRDSRIMVIHKKNGGLSDARNAGLDAAVGEYIYFLDGDDYIEPNLVETVLRHMMPGVDMVAFPYLAHKTDGTVSKSKTQIGCYDLPDGKSRADFTVDILLQYKIGWEAWSRMYVRDNIERYGLRFADNREIFAEDLYFCLCYCAHAQKVVCIPDALYHYILRDDSIMGANHQKLNVGRMNRLAKCVKAFYEETEDCSALLDVFPTIHYFVIANVLERGMRNRLICGREGRKKLLEDIDDYPFFCKSMKAVLKNSFLLQKHEQGVSLAEKLSFLRYVIDGNYPMLVLRSRYLNRYSDRVNERFGIGAYIKRKEKQLSGEHYDIYIIGTEDFGNIGDHEIARAMLAFLNEHCEGKKIKEITAGMYPYLRTALLRSISENALIVMPGGGNFGDVYPVAQGIREDVIKTWKSNPKIVFPQTIHFTDSDIGRQYLDEAKNIYAADHRVVLVLRERCSYEFAREQFGCRCILVPDIVLSQDQTVPTHRDNKILLVLRSDREKISDLETERINVLQNSFLQKLDHQLDRNIPLEYREQTVKWVLEQYRHASLVITDRLHGMVFAAVTGTPCVALPSYDHKIPGTYEWLRQLDYIRLVDSVDQVNEAVCQLRELGPQSYDNGPLMPYFEKLAKVVKECAVN